MGKALSGELSCPCGRSCFFQPFCTQNSQNSKEFWLFCVQKAQPSHANRESKRWFLFIQMIEKHGSSDEGSHRKHFPKLFSKPTLLKPRFWWLPTCLLKVALSHKSIFAHQSYVLGSTDKFNMLTSASWTFI